MPRILLALLLLLAAGQAFVAAEETPLPAKAKADPLGGPPFVSAKAWAIADGKTGKLLWGHNETTQRVMASTTKIMTAWIVLELAAKDPKVLDEVVTVSARADKTGGSSAKIETGERYAVRDMLYGLLLPSGNDAAVALAEHFGSRFGGKKEKDDAFTRFVAEMNRRAKALEMTETHYFDPHGNSKNHSCARDLLILAHAVLENPLLAKYVQARRHVGTATTGKGEKREVVWNNTNRLLNIEGFDGVKTGTTGAAGACLVSSGRRGDDHLLMVVLGSSSSDGRYVDSRNLYRWAWEKRGHKE